MAFYKNPSAIKRSILAFVKHLLSKPLYRAFEILLSPCCNPVVTNATAVCNGDGTFTVTLTLANAISLAGVGNDYLSLFGISPGWYVFASTVDLNTNTIVFENVTPPTDNTSFSLRLEMVLPTNTTETIGVILYSDIFDLYFPVCP
jgi:hypothetical protein